MGYFVRFLLAACVAIIAYAVYSLNNQEAIQLHIADDGWFGGGKKRADDERIVPFRVNVSNEAIEDLKHRLRNARVSFDPLEDADNFLYGFNSKYLRQVTHYWINKYNWRFYEGIINTLPQYTTEIEGLKVHFIHAKPNEGAYKVVVPLLIVHGWPGNVFEFYKIIPMLLDPVQQVGSDVDLAFEVVAPSVPGFAWSGAPKKTGFNTEAAARVLWKLMTRLGFSRFLMQGGDWGSAITSDIAFYFPQNVIGLHLNMAMVMNWKAVLYQFIGTIAPKLMYALETFRHSSPSTFFRDAIQETGYLHIQATKPDTVGLAMCDSPAGLAAYILEKFSTGTDIDYRSLPDGGLTKKFTLDELLTIVSIYWFNGNIVNSQRFYKEYFRNPFLLHNVNRFITVPTGYAAFPKDFMRQPKQIMQTMFNLTSYTEMKSGGHFAAFEEPKLLVDDIIKFAKTIPEFIL